MMQGSRLEDLAKEQAMLVQLFVGIRVSDL